MGLGGHQWIESGASYWSSLPSAPLSFIQDPSTRKLPIFVEATQPPSAVIPRDALVDEARLVRNSIGLGHTRDVIFVFPLAKGFETACHAKEGCVSYHDVVACAPGSDCADDAYLIALDYDEPNALQIAVGRELARAITKPALDSNLGWRESSTWDRPSGTIAFVGSPDATSWGPGRIDLVATAKDANGEAALYRATWFGNNGSGWSAISVDPSRAWKPVSGPAVSTPRGYEGSFGQVLDVFVIGDDGNLHHAHSTNDGKSYAWETWAPPSGVALKDDPDATAWGLGSRRCVRARCERQLLARRGRRIESADLEQLAQPGPRFHIGSVGAAARRAALHGRRRRAVRGEPERLRERRRVQHGVDRGIRLERRAHLAVDADRRRVRLRPRHRLLVTAVCPLFVSPVSGG
jgi:hypothetical protein